MCRVPPILNRPARSQCRLVSSYLNKEREAAGSDLAPLRSLPARLLVPTSRGKWTFLDARQPGGCTSWKKENSFSILQTTCLVIRWHCQTRPLVVDDLPKELILLWPDTGSEEICSSVIFNRPPVASNARVKASESLTPSPPGHYPTSSLRTSFSPPSADLPTLHYTSKQLQTRRRSSTTVCT